MSVEAPLGPCGANQSSLSSLWGRGVASILLVTSVLAASVPLAPAAVADSTANLRGALTKARQGTSCGPLRSDPLIERGAAIINRSTDRWASYTARVKPIDVPVPVLPILRDLGYHGTKARQLQGVGATDAVATKGAILEGFSLILGDAAILNCTYTDYGVNVVQNQRTGNFLAAVVLAGP